MTPLEAPWRSGKTERAGRDWKEDYFKMTQDGPEAQTWKDFEEDCDAVNQAHTSKNNDSGYSAYQRVLAGILHRWKMLFWRAEKQIRVVVSRQQTGELSQERSMTMRRTTLQAIPALGHKHRWKRALYHAAKHYKGELHAGQPLWFWRRGANAVRNQQTLFGTRAWLSAHAYHSLDSLLRFCLSEDWCFGVLG